VEEGGVRVVRVGKEAMRAWTRRGGGYVCSINVFNHIFTPF